MSYLNISKNALIATLLISSFQSALASSHHVTKATGHKTQGVYSDLLLGYGWTSAENSYGRTASEGEISGNLDLGYQFNRNFALELGLGYTANLSAKFILPLNQCTDLFAKVGGGVALIETHYSDRDYEGKFAGNLSVGATHWLTQNWGLTGQINYARVFADGNDTSYNATDLTVGVSYHF